ncbi:sensor histidine kinase [Candidatus Palauibacter sp.]|uniref:sensor histidine kinase n=1 Tax=Candidatus Palauibacter sp. TaxID=3101350 RepID=UPI003CC68D48
MTRFWTRRGAALLVAILSSGVLLSFVVFSRQQAEERRLDAAVFGRLRAISVAAAAGNLSVEEVNALWNGASAEVLAQVERLQIPVVVTDTLGNPTSWSHLPEDFPLGPDGKPDVQALPSHFEAPGLQVYFGDPEFLRRLEWIPWLAAAALVVIVGGGAWLLFTSFRSERERIWSAMARESAHQMGTPLSSLVGWLEVLEDRSRPEAARVGQPDLIDEMAADVSRLQKVSRRFELIGHKTKLEPVSVRATVVHLKQYFEARLPALARVSKIEIEVNIDPEAPDVLGNETLLEWAFENLIRNAVDALATAGGRIEISHLGPNGKRSVYRVSDTGPGIPPALGDKVFNIGVTTKERGWGVGLSLTRRIIEDMHDGSIRLEDTPRGASFRIELPRHRPRKPGR